MDESVVVIVKAPNQQIDDQTVHCELNWTIRQLKTHLSEVYPSKPRIEEQKLIYSGQLLTDGSTLKDVLRMYEGQENHTVHLVCSPTKESLRAAAMSANKPKVSTPPPASPQEPAAAPSSTVTQDGLRQRTAGSYVYPQSWTGVGPAGQTPPVWPMFGSYDPTNVAQQMAWMQQAYMQYMTQYMQLMASGNVPIGMQVPGAVGGTPPNNHVAPPPPLRDEPAMPNDAVQNAGEEEEARVNRDWLDWFYIMSRMLVLFSIIYFYSSPVRFFIVSTLGIIMYLYQVGFFRAVQRLDQPEEVPATPPPTPDNNNTPPADTTPPPPPPAPSAFALTWAAFSSFFLSLIPEQPNVL